MKKPILFLFTFLAVTCTTLAQSWTTISTGTLINFRSCAFGSASTVYVVGDSIGYIPCIKKSTDAGLSFSSISTSFLPASPTLCNVYFKSADTGFVAGGIYSPTASITMDNGFIYRTTNGGASWTPVVTGASTEFKHICFSSSNIGYALASYMNFIATVYKTTDGGATWALIYTSTTPLSLTQIGMTDDNTGIITGEDPTTHEAITVNITGGAVSGVSTFSTYAAFGAINFTSGTTGFVMAYAGTATAPSAYILKTTDGGTTWTTAYSGYEYAETIQFDGSEGFAPGGGVLKTTDGGATWGLMGPITTAPGSIFNMAIKNHVRLIVGEYSLIVRQGGTTAVDELTTTADAPALCPNPSNGQTYLTFKNAQTNALINITDISGRIVKHFTMNGNRSAINTTDMPSGTYVVSASNATGITNTTLTVH